MGCNRKFYGSLEYQDCQKRKINTIKNTQYIGVKIEYDSRTLDANVKY